MFSEFYDTISHLDPWMQTTIGLLLLAALAYVLRFESHLKPDQLLRFAGLLPLILLVKIPLFYLCGLYRGMWRYTSLDDVIRIFFVYSVFFGMAVGVMKKSHLNIDVFVHALPEKARANLELLSNVLVTVFLSAVFWYSFRFVSANADQYTPYLMFPMSYVYAIIPVCTSVMIAFLAVDTFRALFRRPTQGR